MSFLRQKLVNKLGDRIRLAFVDFVTSERQIKESAVNDGLAR